jgi:hypothetical protein
MNGQEVANGLREMADVVEKLDDLHKLGVYPSMSLYVYLPEHFRAIARQIGTFDKLKDANNYVIERRFSGGVKLTAQIDRGKICRKVKVMREVDEFECDDSLLDPTPETAEVPS